MPLIWDNTGRYDMPLIIEDPRAGNDGFYIDGRKHDKTSLTPTFGRRINFKTTDSKTWEVLDNVYDNGSNTRSGNSLSLSKMTVGCPKPNAADPNTNDASNWPGCNHWLDMSFNNGVGAGGWKHGSSFVLSDGVNQTTHIGYTDSNTYRERAWPSMPDTTDLDEKNPTFRGSFSESYTPSRFCYWGKPFKEGDRTWLPSIRTGYSSSYYPNGAMNIGYDNTAGEEWPDSKLESDSIREVLGMGNYYQPQIIGETADGTGLLMIGSYNANSRGGVSTVQFKIVQEKWTNNSYTPVSTNILDYQTSPVAGGSHQGGNFNNAKAFWITGFSQHFDDPRGTANTKCFYGGYYDSYGNYAPFVVTWNTTNDTFAMEPDVSLDVDSTTHADLRNCTVSGNTSSSRHASAPTVTWTSGSNRYVCDFKTDGRETFFENDVDWRTWVVYKMDPSTPKTLTYHSKVLMPGHARQWIWLNDSQTLLGVWFQNNFVVYAWNDTTGWNSTTTVPGPIYDVGRDSLDRIWYTKASSTQEYRMEVHLLTPTLPVTISVTPENASYTYSGSDIVSYLDVSAINASGARIATNVKLTIEGSSMKFSDDTTTKTVTTLTTGDLQVATKVVGAGFTNVAASIEI